MSESTDAIQDLESKLDPEHAVRIPRWVRRRMSKEQRTEEYRRRDAETEAALLEPVPVNPYPTTRKKVPITWQVVAKVRSYRNSRAEEGLSPEELDKVTRERIDFLKRIGAKAAEYREAGWSQNETQQLLKRGVSLYLRWYDAGFPELPPIDEIRVR